MKGGRNIGGSGFNINPGAMMGNNPLPPGASHSSSGVGVNVFAPRIETMQRLLVIQNLTSGWRTAADTFALSVSETLDKAGVVHTIRQSPPEQIQHILRDEGEDSPFSKNNNKNSPVYRQPFDSVLICGGDGALNAYAYATTLPEFASWRSKPVAILPCGANNGIASSLGISHVGCTTASFISGRTADVPIWSASLDGRPLSVALSGVNIGTFADALVSSRQLRDYMAGFVALPSIRNRNWWSIMYHATFGGGFSGSGAGVVPMSIRVTDPVTGVVRGLDGSGEAKQGGGGGGFKMVYASQALFHHANYCLTPHAQVGKKMKLLDKRDGKPKLAVTTVSGDASRSRLLHLLLKEATGRGDGDAANGTIEPEDGVDMFEAEKIDICLGGGSKQKMFLLDGEECEIEPGQTLSIAPTDMRITVMIP